MSAANLPTETGDEGQAVAAALRVLAEALPAGSAVPVPREVLLGLLKPRFEAGGAAPDRLLTVDEVAQRLGLSPSHVYRAAPRWPFARKLAPKVLRFSERGLERWLNRQRAS